MRYISKKWLSILFFSLILTSGIFLQAAMAAGNVGKISDSSFYDSNTFYVVGEVINTGDTAIQNVNVKVIFYNSSNQVITSISGFTDLNIILAGRKSFFNIRMLESEGSLNVKNYTVWFNWTDTSVGKPLGLVILSSSESIDAQGHKHITGQIQNQGTVNSNNTEVSATFYNSTGTVIGTSWAFSSPSNLAPNEIGNYDVELIYTQQVAKAASWSLTAESGALAFSPTPLTPSPSPSPSPSRIASPTSSPSVSPSSSVSPTESPSASTTPTASISPSSSPSPTSSSTANPSPSLTASADTSPSPTASTNPLPTSSAATSPSPTEGSANTSTDFPTAIVALIAIVVLVILAAVFIFYRMRKKELLPK